MILRCVRRPWFAGLAVVLTLMQSPSSGWASHGHGGGGHFSGGGHIGGGHMGGFSGGGFSGGGFSGGHHFSAPTHSMSVPSHHFSVPSHTFSNPRPLVTPSYHAPTVHTPTLNGNVHHGGITTVPNLSPGKGLTHGTGAFPTLNGSVKSPTIVPTFGQHHVNGTLSHGVLNGGHNPYSSSPSIGGVKSHPLGGSHGTTLPNVTHHQLPGIGHTTSSLGGTHTTLKPSIGGPNLINGHPHIGGHNGSIANVAHTHSIKGGNVPAGNNLPQFQSHHHGNQGNWGLGNGPGNGGNGPNGIGGNNWNAAWRNNCVHHHHHHWYNGAWGGYWGLGFYAPFAWGAGYWGLGSFYSPWSYGYNYYNPYCVAVVQPAYASLPVTYYSQPVALPSQPVSDDADAGRAAAYQLVDAARSDFRNGRYTDALGKLDQAIPQLPNDSVVHELRGVALFALGDYRPAAATLNAVLAVAPGMDWATLRGLYSTTETYEAQLRRLEQSIKANPQDPASRFVLAYLYMVTNYPEAATVQLKKVVELEPQDVVSKRLLESMTQAAPAPSPEAASVNAAQTDLVGRWQAKANGITFDLTLNDTLQFDWQVTPANGPTVKQSGRYTATSDRLIFESAGEETLVAKVQSQGTDRFQFWANDKQALTFERQGSVTVTAPTPVTEPATPSQSALPEPPPPALEIPAPLAPVIGPNGQPLVPSPVDATKPENLLPVIP